MAIAIATVVADAVSAQRVGAGGTVQGNAVLAVAVEHTAGEQAAPPGDACDAASGNIEAGFAVLEHHAVADDQAVRAPIGNAEAIAGAMAAEDLQSARRRPHALLQLEKDAVRGVVGGDAVGDIGALDPVPAADADADPRAAGLVAAIHAAAAHRIDALEHAVLEEVAAQAGGRGVVDVEVTERGAHHELQVEALGARLVLR